jgi:hypothetical protein
MRWLLQGWHSRRSGMRQWEEHRVTVSAQGQRDLVCLGRIRNIDPVLAQTDRNAVRLRPDQLLCQTFNWDGRVVRLLSFSKFQASEIGTRHDSPLLKLVREICGADGGGRTHTLVRVPDFESSASANSATSAQSTLKNTPVSARIASAFAEIVFTIHWDSFPRRIFPRLRHVSIFPFTGMTSAPERLLKTLLEKGPSILRQRSHFRVVLPTAKCFAWRDFNRSLTCISPFAIVAASL